MLFDQASIRLRQAWEPNCPVVFLPVCLGNRRWRRSHRGRGSYLQFRLIAASPLFEMLSDKIHADIVTTGGVQQGLVQIRLVQIRPALIRSRKGRPLLSNSELHQVLR
jgi:hypothetical protein